MSLQQLFKAMPRSALSAALLLPVILFDGGGNLMKFLFDGPGLHKGVHAASKDHTSPSLLREVFPDADSFSEKEGEVPVYKAYRTDPANGEQTLLGYAFVSADTQPEPSGYSGNIDTLIGMDLDGNIVGLKVIYYKESHRYTLGDFFSWGGYEDQFIGKRAEERFQVGKDIDGITKATISTKAMSAGVRRSIRAVTLAYLR